MSMKVNVIYRGIIYRVRGIRILCSVLTAVFLLLLALIGLGVWMLISTYGEDKYIPEHDKSNGTAEINKESVVSESNKKITASIDFEQPPDVNFNNISVQELPNYPVVVPNEVHETIGLFQAAVPANDNYNKSENVNSNKTLLVTYVAPNPSYGLFSHNFNNLDVTQNQTENVSNETNTNENNPDDYKDDFKDDYYAYDYEKIPDSYVEYSNANPIYVAPPPSANIQPPSIHKNKPNGVVEYNDYRDHSDMMSEHEYFTENYDYELPLTRREGVAIVTDNSHKDESSHIYSDESEIEDEKRPEPIPYRNATESIHTNKTAENPLRWQLKMGQILGLPPHMMPKELRQQYNSMQSKNITLNNDTQELPAHRRTDRNHNNMPSEDEYYSSSYPMKQESAYPDLLKYTSNMQFNNPQRNENTQEAHKFNPQTEVKVIHTPVEPNIKEVNVTEKIAEENKWYDHRVGISAAKPLSSYDGPSIVGYGNKPFQNQNYNSSASMLNHFWEVYNSSNSVPKIHEDRGPVPEDTKIYLVDYNLKNLDSKTTAPSASVRGSMLYAPQKNASKIHSHMNAGVWNYYDKQFTSQPVAPEREKPEEYDKNPDTHSIIEHIQRQPPAQRTNKLQNTYNEHIARNPHIEPRRKLIIKPEGQRIDKRVGIRISPDYTETNFEDKEYDRQAHIAQRPNLHSRDQRPMPPLYPNRRHGRPQMQIKQPVRYAQPPDNSLGPLQGLYDYSTKIANSIFSFPKDMVMTVKNSSEEYFDSTIKLLKGYNTIFTESAPQSGDTNDAPNRSERIMIPGFDDLGPFQMSLVAWTFLDFWEFLIEKIGVLSTQELDLLKQSLQRRREESNNIMARTLVQVTMDNFKGSRSSPGLLIHPQLRSLLKTVKDMVENNSNRTMNAEGRMFDPFGIFDSQQKAQFAKFAAKVLFNFGKVYLQKSYALDCMLLMFCKDLNHRTRKEGLPGFSAKIKTVGLKVLTDREDRQEDTIGEIWTAISAYSPLQCETMFPKCDGSKALEIVNDVAAGSS